MRVIVSSLCKGSFQHSDYKHQHGTSLSQPHAKRALIFTKLSALSRVKPLLNLAGCKTLKPVHFDGAKRGSASTYQPHVHQRSQTELLLAVVSGTLLRSKKSFGSYHICEKSLQKTEYTKETAWWRHLQRPNATTSSIPSTPSFFSTAEVISLRLRQSQSRTPRTRHPWHLFKIKSAGWLTVWQLQILDKWKTVRALVSSWHRKRTELRRRICWIKPWRKTP